MITQFLASPSSLYPDQLDLLVRNELVEYSNRIRSPAHAGNDRRGQLSFCFENLRLRLLSNYFMKSSHNRWIRMRPQHTSQQIMRRADIREPIATSFIDGIFQRARTRVHPPDFCAQQSHAEDVQLLPPHVFRSHVNHTLKAK